MKPRIQRVSVTPRQVATLVDQFLGALDRGDAGAARCYAESLRARLHMQTAAENVVLDEAARTPDERAARVVAPQ